MAVKVPTDLEILQTIYDKYYEDFCKYDEEESIRNAKIYVPIDCQMIAKELGVNGDIIFGRLYYHLANKFKYTDHGKTSNGKEVTVRLFEFDVDGDPKCVNFPFMASVLADLRVEDSRFRWTLYASIAALVISCVSLAIAGYELVI
ncbi:hypothetical protein ACWLOZ_004323 [Vibrio parahaemolyticus]